MISIAGEDLGGMGVAGSWDFAIFTSSILEYGKLFGRPRDFLGIFSKFLSMS
jgi:hypothetical protein